MNDKPTTRNPFAAPAAADHARRIQWARRSLRIISPALAALLLMPMAAQATSSDPPDTTTTTQVATATASSGLASKVHTVFNAVAGDTRSATGTAEASTNVLTIKAVSVKSTYGDVPVTYSVEVTGLKAGDTAAGVTAGLRITGPQPDADSGVYDIKPSGLAVPSGYTGVSYVNGKHVIAQAPLEVRVKDLDSMYGKTPQFDVRYYGLRNGDTVPAHVAAPVTVVDGTETPAVAADASTNAGSYDVYAQAWDSNYDIATTPGNWTVHKAPLSVRVDSVTTTWGDPKSPYHTDVRGLVNGDTTSDLTPIRVDGPGGTPDVGLYQLMLSGGTSPNYETSYDAASMRVERRHVTVTVDNKTRVYGSPNPKLTATVTGMPAGMTLLTSFDPVPKDLGVGTYDIRFQRPDDANLDIEIRRGTLTTTPAPLTIRPSRATIASGTVATDLGWHSTGWVYDHTESRLLARPTCSAAVVTKPGVYPHAITCAGAQAPAGYAIAYAKATLTVNPLMTLQATGLPSGTTPRATVDGQQVTLPRAAVEVPFASRHAYSFPGVVKDANNRLRITTAAAFDGEVRDNVSVTATYSTMGKLLSDAVTAGQLKSDTGRQLANVWALAEQDVISDFQPLAGLREFAEQVKTEVTGEVAATLLAHAQVVFAYAGGEGSL